MVMALIENDPNVGNPEDGKMFLLVPAHPGCPGQSPESHKMVVCVCMCVLVITTWHAVAHMQQHRNPREEEQEVTPQVIHRATLLLCDVGITYLFI